MVDLVYQRATNGSQSQRIIAGMVRHWDWRLCQPLNVARRNDGGLYVIDGQHRLEGARHRGDVLHLPCVIASSADVGEEAQTFVALNQRRQKLSQGDVFSAQLAAGDPDAKHAFELIEGAGLSLARTHTPAAWKPGEIFCGPAIASAIKRYGDGVVMRALNAIAQAYRGLILERAATLLQPLYIVYSTDARSAGWDNARFVSTLAAITQRGWLGKGAELQTYDPSLNARDAIAGAMLSEYEDRKV